MPDRRVFDDVVGGLAASRLVARGGKLFGVVFGLNGLANGERRCQTRSAHSPTP